MKYRCLDGARLYLYMEEMSIGACLLTTFETDVYFPLLSLPDPNTSIGEPAWTIIQPCDHK
jgi:hypothetical protein